MGRSRLGAANAAALKRRADCFEMDLALAGISVLSASRVVARALVSAIFQCTVAGSADVLSGLKPSMLPLPS